MSYLEKVAPLFGLRLETDRLVLRFMDLEEAAYLTSASKSSYEEVFASVGKNIFSDNNTLPLAIFPCTTGMPIGILEIDASTLQEAKKVTVNFWIIDEWRRQGYETEALRAACSFAFQELGALQIVAKNIDREAYLAIGFKGESVLTLDKSDWPTHHFSSVYGFDALKPLF